MTLRARLTILVVVLLAIAIAAIGVVAVTAARNSTVGRIERFRSLVEHRRPPPPPPSAGAPFLPPNPPPFFPHPRLLHLREGRLLVSATTAHVRRITLIGGGAILLVAAGLTWLLIPRGLAPVDRMVATAGERRLRRFIGDASHELRTPVSSIRGYAELYRRGGLKSGPELDRAMARIEGESTRIGRLVEDMALLARLDQERPLERERVDLAVLARDSVADLRAAEPDREVSLTAAGDSVVLGDEQRLRQVLANLLSNTRVHTPAATPVEVTVSRDGEEVVLTVSDHGPGVPEEDRERIFERFYRGDVSRSRETGGSGLGLSIVTAVVTAHGGRAQVGAAPGGGARFEIRLPAAI